MVRQPAVRGREEHTPAGLAKDPVGKALAVVDNGPDRLAQGAAVAVTRSKC